VRGRVTAPRLRLQQGVAGRLRNCCCRAAQLLDLNGNILQFCVVIVVCVDGSVVVLEAGSTLPCDTA
jgi:hypothetical protein